jgi:hypothetical protein
MKRRNRKSVNLLELMPRQLVPWEADENGTVVVLLPKFQNAFLVRWLVPRLRVPNIRIKLDAIGSYVWKLCDGKTTVAEIAERMAGDFGESATAAHERIRTFLLTLEKSDLVNLSETGTPNQYS